MSDAMQRAEKFIQLYPILGSIEKTKETCKIDANYVYKKFPDKIKVLTKIRIEERKKENRRLQLYKQAKIIEYYVCNPDKSMNDIATEFRVSHTNVARIVDQYFKPSNGTAITLSSNV